MPASLAIRTVTAETLDHVLDIQAACYPPAYLESREVFARKLALSHDSHWLAWHGDSAVGYFFTHPWRGRTPPALGTSLASLPADPDCHFLHDLAVHPQARGSGAAQALVDTALGWGNRRGLTDALLVAVQGAAPYWVRQGFHAIGPAPAYGEHAVLMHRRHA
ncbi:GNAT family N-acetyltransferase [Jeongeupia chitinilytica]|uniref:N-acetyltransferase n=1 Tax=Jeongeupia chitinilytica TaxID=1041641 RepID=A0ABQ3GY13_9NEIS|nr:GNAT family N-acetyltransferase [Jeongeupia chitinilytica]GHD59146.1 N-acetyltransferase [Jeongeupia chitinilytica]